MEIKMSKSGKDKMTADIKWMLDKYIESIILTYQQAMEIKNGDIEPLNAIYLDTKTKAIADVMTEILLKQSGEYYE